MDKKIYLLSLFLLTFVFISCEETKDEGEFYAWRERNEAFIDSLQNVVDSKSDPSLLYVVDNRDKSQNIFFKKIESVDEGISPVLTSKVKVFYRGMLINEAVFGATSSPRFYTKQYRQLRVFDKNFTGDDPGEFDSSSLFALNGSTTAMSYMNNNGCLELLQWMKPGERWEVYIPWKSGFGSSGIQNVIPGYSALIYDINLVEIEEY